VDDDMCAVGSVRLQLMMVEHHRGILRFLRRMGLPPHRAEDLAQTAFLIALEALPRITPGCERAFVYATAARLVYDVRRRARREVFSADLDLDSSPHPPPDDLAHQKRARELFDAVIDEIDHESRNVFIRFEVQGFTIPEIATDLEIPAEAATCRLRRARKQFRALVRDLNLA
jgi:RNA polymerase sigma-70 factor (ECF subfamily)